MTEDPLKLLVAKVRAQLVLPLGLTVLMKEDLTALLDAVVALDEGLEHIVRRDNIWPTTDTEAQTKIAEAARAKARSGIGEAK